MPYYNVIERYILKLNNNVKLFLGIISKILECKLFTILARISYVLYLTHLIVQLQTVGEIRQPYYGNFWLLVTILFNMEKIKNLLTNLINNN